MGRSGLLVSVARFVWIAAALILFAGSGCFAQDNRSVDAEASKGRGVLVHEAAAQAGGELQSSKEKIMVQLFSLLLQMDQEPATAIGKEQAEAMLPIINRSVSTGNLLPEDEQAIVNLLRYEQKAFYTERQRHSENGRFRGDLYKSHPVRSGYPKSGDSEGPEAWAAGEKSMEQQLIELLAKKR